MRCLGSVSGEWVERTIAVLERVGITCRRGGGGGDGDGGDPCDGRLVLFDEVQPALLAELRALAGATRVLAIASRPLATDDVFALRRSGASEVVGWHAGCDPAGAIAARLGRWAEID
ncbi:MAG TPA: hypothetical protein VK607_20365, partial [Kofleriaceae bacterium]|nr:hypothetical protein [Kofleriaceae bacterium]